MGILTGSPETKGKRCRESLFHESMNLLLIISAPTLLQGSLIIRRYSDTPKSQILELLIPPSNTGKGKIIRTKETRY